MSFATVCNHLRPFAMICDDLRPFANICDDLRQFATVFDRSPPFATICNRLWLFVTTCDDLPTCDSLQQFVIVCDNLRSFVTVSDHLQPFATVCDYLRPFVTTAFHRIFQLVQPLGRPPVSQVFDLKVRVKCSEFSEIIGSPDSSCYVTAFVYKTGVVFKQGHGCAKWENILHASHNVNIEWYGIWISSIHNNWPHCWWTASSGAIFTHQ